VTLHRDHVRSRKAFEHVKGLQGTNAEAYGRLALKLPFLIRSSGLAQALVFIDQKSGTEIRLLDDLADTVAVVTQQPELNTRARLIQAAMLTDEPALYLELSREVLRTASWYKRLSTSVLGVEPGGEK